MGNNHRLAYVYESEQVFLPGDLICMDYFAHFKKVDIVVTPDGQTGCLCEVINADKEKIELTVVKVVEIEGRVTIMGDDTQYCLYKFIDELPMSRMDIQHDVISAYISLFEGEQRIREQEWIDERLPLKGFYLSYYISNALGGLIDDQEEGWQQIKYELLTRRSETKRLRILRKALSYEE